MASDTESPRALMPGVLRQTGQRPEDWVRQSEGKRIRLTLQTKLTYLIDLEILRNPSSIRATKMQIKHKELITSACSSSSHMIISHDKTSSGSFLIELDVEMESENDQQEEKARRLLPPTKCYILDLPIEILESICREYIDTTTATCLGLTCHSFFNITEHIYPYQVNLHMRTKGTNRKCLGHLLTDWMLPKYSFDHSWGKFLLKRHWRMDEDVVDRKWREKEGWRRIRLVPDKLGAVVAYEGSRGGF